MPKSARLSDPDNAGGQVASAVSGDIIVNGKPMALLNSIESAHAPWGPPHPPHAAPTIVSASGVVIGNNRGAAYVGSGLSCGHQIVDGSPDVFVGLAGGGGGGPAKSAVSLPAESTQTPQTAEDRKSIAASKQQALADPETVKLGIAKGEPTNQAAEAAAPGNQQENVLEDKIWQTLQANLEVCIEEAKGGNWKETGKKTGSSNPNIMACYKAVGCPQPNDDTAWCAGYAGAMLKKAGAKYLKTLLSRAYVNYGQKIPVNDPTQWRMNDIVIFQRPGGGHIGFVKAVDPVGQRLLVVGGNQGDNLTQTVFKFNGSVSLTDVRRAWSLPAAADVSIVTTNIAAAPPNIKVT
jgi:uncharacterized protein (TIGR02594 family)